MGDPVFGSAIVSPWDIRERVEAAAKVGYRGIGMIHGDDGLRSLVTDNGIRHVELEPIRDWFGTGSARARCDANRADFLNAAEQLGVRHIIEVAGSLQPENRDKPNALDQMRIEFARLAQQARDSGTLAVLEPIAFSSVPGLASEIAALPEMSIGLVGLDDGSAEAHGDPLAETLNERQPCDEGEFDLQGLIKAVYVAGYEGPWSVEIFSDEQRARTIGEAASRSFAAAAGLFENHGRTANDLDLA